MPNKSISRECCREAAKAVHAQMFAWDGFKHAPINECHKCDELAEIIAKHCHAEPDATDQSSKREAQEPQARMSEKLQAALRKLSMALGNPAIEFEAGEIEAGLVEYAARWVASSHSAVEPAPPAHVRRDTP